MTTSTSRSPVPPNGGTDTPNPTNEPLPIVEIFLKSITLSFEKIGQLLRLAWPYALYLLVDNTFLSIPPPESIESLEPFELLEFQQSMIFILGFGLISLFLGPMAGVGCHRVFLLDKEEALSTKIFRWQARERDYFVCYFLIFILSSIPTIVISILLNVFYSPDVIDLEKIEVISFLEYLLTMLPSFYIFSRLSLLLPGSALGRYPTLVSAWKASSGNAISLFILIGVLPLITGYLLDTFQIISNGSLLFKFIGNIAMVVIITIELCCLSLSYEWIKNRDST
ncbi:MAG: hypothetical protein COC19_04640 [SAR86 cluster bacterium]|uniref:Uncharacterized protein n=1 Tax=SAR86 cluster bacterium TaxID=2030880 RepID=A0A2A4MP81_9GAMM|nr:MAG: hypothetical protein COC19_04640 [SAR86 cluster bacterium]